MPETYKEISFNFFDKDKNEQKIEWVWATSIGDYYKIDNIPLYAYRYSAEDIVSVIEGDGKELQVVSLIQPSGNSTVRILFKDLSEIDSIKEELILRKCDFEVGINENSLAVNIPKSVSYKKIIDYLESLEDLQYEESCMSEYHKNQS
ncbi:DUF4265 domain-containing protein [uncultured Flavobacterium sp.]|uniref:DUF4265 domain-containing protein n=1 Tax=uncultured Flavobacterium sp. TaxID=165435 RepID=UPI0025D37602|nr:DUF4265 domain-containing protein [uncultured Flavobacterium sp.]